MKSVAYWQIQDQQHRLINNSRYRTLDVVFFKIQGFFVHNNPEAKAQKQFRACGVEQTLSLSRNFTQHARNSFGRLAQDYCERKTHKSLKDDNQCSICIVINPWAILTKTNLVGTPLYCSAAIEKKIYIRGEFTRKNCKTAILFYCFHTAGILHLFMLYSHGISFYRKSKIVVKIKPNYEIGWFHN